MTMIERVKLLPGVVAAFLGNDPVVCNCEFTGPAMEHIKIPTGRKGVFHNNTSKLVETATAAPAVSTPPVTTETKLEG